MEFLKWNNFDPNIAPYAQYEIQMSKSIRCRKFGNISVSHTVRMITITVQ